MINAKYKEVLEINEIGKSNSKSITPQDITNNNLGQFDQFLNDSLAG